MQTDVIVTSVEDIKEAFLLWGKDVAEGKTMTSDEANRLPLEERAGMDAASFINYLGLVRL